MKTYYPNQLVHKKENIYFALVIVFSILAYLFLAITMVGLAIIVAMILLSLFFHGLMMGGIRRNGVRINEHQFPEVYERAVALAEEMGLKKVPDIYVLESQGILNAFATRFFGRDMVVLYSEIFELIDRNAEDELMFVLAHELAHIKRKHILTHILLLPAMWVPFVGEAYLRACEYTCDRYATYYVKSLPAAKNALTLLSIGKSLYKQVNQEAYMKQIETEAGFFAWLNEKLSSHPHLPKRVYEVQQFFSEEEFVTLKEPKKRIVIGLLVAFLLSLVLVGSVYTVFKAVEKLDLSALGLNEMLEVEGMTPLMEAASENDVEQMQTLMEEGADLEETDIDGSTALHYAIYSNGYEAAQLLLEKGADPNVPDSYDTTPLMDAVFVEDIALVELLLEYGADKEYADSDGYTAYDYALDYENAEIQALLEPKE